MKKLIIIFAVGVSISLHGQNVPAAKELTEKKDELAAKKGQIIDGSNWDDQDIANAYNDYTGKRVLLSSATRDLEIRFYQQGPLTNSQAAKILEKILNMEGYALVPSGANEVKLLPKAQGQNTNAPEEYENLIDNPQDIPDGDGYISYFMSLSFIKPDEAIRTFTQSLHGLGIGTKIAPIPNASALIISGQASFVRKLINQKRYIDVPAGNVSTLWVPLQYADAEEVANSLNEIINNRQKSRTSASVTASQPVSNNRRISPPDPGASPSATTSSSGAGETIPIQIVPNVRLNKIFIMGRPVDVAFVESLIHQFDAPPNQNNWIQRKVRFMIASEFLDVASKALEAMEGKGSTQGSSRSNQRNPSRTSGNNSSGTNSSTGVDSVQEFNVSEAPEAIVVGKTLIVADNMSNTVLVHGPPESLRLVSNLIDRLDQRPQQVMISAVFGEMTLGNERDIGIALGNTSSGRNRGVAGESNPGLGALQEITALSTVAGLNAATATGLNIYGQVSDFVGMLRALETQSNFKILSRPTVYTSNNRKAVISSGSKIAVPTNTFSTGGVDSATQSTNIEYIDVLLRFEVVPLINSKDEVTLRISLVKDDTQGSQIIDGNVIPTIVSESLSTTVSIKNGTTVVLGGLITEAERNTRSGIPVLSRIPGIGRLFRRDIKETERKELLIFIQASVTSGENDREYAQSNLEQHYDVSRPTKNFANGFTPRKNAPPSYRKSYISPKK